MTIQTFAALKDYFEPQFEVNEPLDDIEDLKNFLILENPMAKVVLELSRFAIDDTFVDLDFKINANDKICIVPPSSGG